MARVRKKYKKKKKLKKYFHGGKYHDTPVVDTNSNVDAYQSQVNERAAYYGSLSPDERFKANNPDAFKTSTVSNLTPEMEGGFRGNLANLSNYMHSGGAPTDFLAEATFIPAISRIFGDPDRGQPGAISQVNNTIANDPNSIFSPSSYLPMLDFLPGAVGARQAGKFVRNARTMSKNSRVVPNTPPSAFAKNNARNLVEEELGLQGPNADVTKNMQFTSSPSISVDDFLKDSSLASKKGNSFLNELARGNKPFANRIQGRVNELSTKRGRQRLVDQYKRTAQANGDSFMPDSYYEVMADARVKELKNVTTFNQLADDYVSTNFMGDRLDMDALRNSSFNRESLTNNAGFFPKGIDFTNSGVTRRSEDMLGMGTSYVDDVAAMDHEINHFMNNNKVQAVDKSLQNITSRNLDHLTKKQTKALDYFRTGSGGQEPSSYLAELRQALVKTGHMKHAPDGYFADVTVDQMKKAYSDLMQSPAYRYVNHPNQLKMVDGVVEPSVKLTSNQRLFDFMNPTAPDFSLLTAEMNKLATGAGAATLYGASGDSENTDTPPVQKYGGKITKYAKGGFFKRTKLGRGLKDIGVASLNLGVQPLEAAMGTDFGIDEKFGYETKLGQTVNDVGEVVGGAVGAVGAQMLNTVVPGASAGLKAVGAGLEGAGLTGQQSAGSTAGSGMGSLYAMTNPGDIEKLSGIFTGAGDPSIPIVKQGAMNYKNKYSQGGMAVNPDIEAESGELLLTEGGVPKSMNPKAGISPLGSNAFEITGNESHSKKGVDLELPSGETIVVSKKRSKKVKQTLALIKKAEEKSKSGDFIDAETSKLTIRNLYASIEKDVAEQQAENGNKSNVMEAEAGAKYSKPQGVSSSMHGLNFSPQSLPGMEPGAYSNLDGSMSLPRYGTEAYGGDREFLGRKLVEPSRNYRDGGRHNKDEGEVERIGQMMNPNIFPQGQNKGYYSPYSHVDYDTGNRSSYPGMNVETLKELTIGSPPKGGLSAGNTLKMIANPWLKATMQSPMPSTTVDNPSEDGLYYKNGGNYIKAQDGLINYNMDPTSPYSDLRGNMYSGNMSFPPTASTPNPSSYNRQIGSLDTSGVQSMFPEYAAEKDFMYNTPRELQQQVSIPPSQIPQPNTPQGLPLRPSPRPHNSANAGMYETEFGTGDAMTTQAPSPNNMGENRVSTGFGMFPSNANPSPNTGMGPHTMPDGYQTPEGYQTTGYPPAKAPAKPSWMDRMSTMMKGMGGQGNGEGMSSYMPYASSAYNIGAGLAGMINPPEEMKASDYQLDGNVRPNRIDPYSQMAPQLQMNATYMNNESSSARRQAYASNQAPKTAAMFGKTNYFNRQLETEANKTNLGLQKYNKGIERETNMYNTQLSSLAPNMFKEGLGQASNTYLALDENKMLKGLSDTQRFSEGQYIFGPDGQVMDSRTGKLV